MEQEEPWGACRIGDSHGQRSVPQDFGTASMQHAQDLVVRSSVLRRHESVRSVGRIVYETLGLGKRFSYNKLQEVVPRKTQHESVVRAHTDTVID